MNWLLTITVWLFLWSGGSIYMLGYVFAWNPWYEGLSGRDKTWIWIGSMSNYSKHLDEEKKRLKEEKKRLDI